MNKDKLASIKTANAVEITADFVSVQILFNTMLNGEVLEQTNMVISPQLAKIMTMCLEQTVNAYESMHGEIKLPERQAGLQN